MARKWAKLVRGPRTSTCPDCGLTSEGWWEKGQDDRICVGCGFEYSISAPVLRVRLKRRVVRIKRRHRKEVAK